MKEIVRAISTNGRWGMAVVSPEEVRLPCEGSLKDLGSVGQVKTFLFEPGSTGTWILAADCDVRIHGGASLAYSTDLQSSRSISLLVLGREAVVEFIGYKGRSSRIKAFIEGVETDIPGPVLLAMGLLQPEGEIVEIEPPAPLQGAMAEAFQRLRRA